jgi:tetratricopeptide (TPR) repeat protein
MVLRFLLPLLIAAVVVAPLTAQQADTVQQAERLVAEKRFADAEALYRQLLAGSPESSEARLGLARTLLWQSRYREATDEFRRLLASRPHDPVEARRGLATAAYWSGDTRTAKRELQRLLVVSPKDEGALQMLAEISSASAPGYSFDTELIDDDQPFRHLTGDLHVWTFSDPLTRWILSVGDTSLDAGATSLMRSASSLWAGGGVESAFPRLRLSVAALLRARRMPNGETEALWDLAATRRIGTNARVALRHDRRPLLRTATAVASAPTAEVAELRWSYESGVLASAAASRLTYFDGNEGAGADGWLLVPLVRQGDSLILRGGASLSYRDTREPRFRLDRLSSIRRPDGSFAYVSSGVYDPYWTPHDLREAR